MSGSSCRKHVAIALIAALAVTAGCSARRATPAANATARAYVSNTMKGTVSVVDPATQKVLLDIAIPRVGPRLPFPAFLAALPDGSKVYVACLNTDSVTVIDTRTNQVTKRIDIGHIPQWLAATPDGEKVLVANDGSGAVVIDTDDDEVSGRIELGSQSVGAAVAPDGKTAWFSTIKGLSVVDVSSTDVIATLPQVGVASPIFFDPTGRSVYVLGVYHPNGSVLVVDAATRAVTATIRVESSPVAAAATADGRWLYVANRGSNTVSAIDVERREVAARMAVGAVPTGLAVSRDGAVIYVADSMSNSLSVISPQSQSVVGKIALDPPPQARPSDVVFVAVP